MWHRTTDRQPVWNEQAVISTHVFNLNSVLPPIVHSRLTGGFLLFVVRKIAIPWLGQSGSSLLSPIVHTFHCGGVTVIWTSYERAHVERFQFSQQCVYWRHATQPLPPPTPTQKTPRKTPIENKQPPPNQPNNHTQPNHHHKQTDNQKPQNPYHNHPNTNKNKTPVQAQMATLRPGNVHIDLIWFSPSLVSTLFTDGILPSPSLVSTLFTDGMLPSPSPVSTVRWWHST